ncbi:MAG: PadR family transcriptional regulator [Chloroflexi bacterium]|nr:PadR family transcriptional regulator [Chloroflexota bacterium]
MRQDKTARFALLGLLVDEAHHGYDLYQHFTDPAGLGQVWHLGMSQMYADLKTLEASDFVKATVEQQDSRPAKKVFALTPAGRAAFREWMATPSRGLREMRVEFIVRLFFARREGRRAVTALIERQDQALRAELARWQVERSTEALDDFGQLVRAFRLNQTQAALTWLKSLRNSTPRR